jgi:HlyD family secretion protein
MTEKKKSTKPVKAIILILVLVTGFLAWWFFLRTPAGPENVIALSGRIESDDSAVAAKLSGRIREINVREGDQVKAGQIIAVLDDDQVKARVDQAQSAVDQSEARVQWSKQQVAVLRAQLAESQISVTQARIDAEGKVAEAQARVAAAEATLAQSEATLAQARYDAERFSRLAEQGDVSEREGKQYQTTAQAQAAVVQASRKQVDAARGALLAAKANLENPAIRTSQAAAIQQQITQAEADILASQADSEKARAQLQEAMATRNDLNITAPFDGTVATRSAEPGEVVTAGTAIITLVDLNQVYLRGFIPEGDIGRVRVGQTARVYLDSDPKKPIDAVVSRIDPEASFTPENTYFRDDRVKQVVGVKLQIVNPQGYAKPGMPADGEVIVDGNQQLAKMEK